MSYQLEIKPVLSGRVKRLKDSFFDEPVKLSTERIKHILEVYKEGGMQAPAIVRARVLEKYLKGMTLFINENPIVGGLTKYRRGCNPYPEWSCHWWKTRPHCSNFGGVEPYLTKEDRELIGQAADYFDGNLVIDMVNEVFAETHPGLSRRDIMRQGFFNDSASSALGYLNADYSKVLNVGLEGIIAEVKRKISGIGPVYLEDIKKRDFWKSVIISCEAVIAWANRYADLAEDMAKNESDLVRKHELLEIARICRHVPAKPARNFREAIQGFWFAHTVLWIEACQVAISPGRLALYMYPFYKKDKESGSIDEEAAIELLELLFIKMSEFAMHLPELGGKLGMPNHLGQNVCVGGVTRDGRDATNELDFLILEADARVRMVQPSTVVIWHNRLSEELFVKGLDNARLGLGKPAFVNGEAIVQRNMDRYKCSIEEARDFSIVGCTQALPAGKNSGAWETLICTAKMLELALNNGTNPVTGFPVGLKTGDPEQFRTYEELHEAVKRQMEYFVALGRDIDMASISFQSQYLPSTFASALMDDCVERGKNLIEGGARYSGDTTCPVATIDMANSLAAVKKVVFDEKRITMKQLREALKANFEGYEEIRKMLIDAPKYGNDDDYADSIAKDWYEIFFNADQIYTNHLGIDGGRPEAVVTSLHRMMGKAVGALPNGRKAFEPFTDGVTSATPGTDLNGPTALLKSASKVLDPVKYDGGILNLKFHPSAWKNKKDLQKIQSLIKSFMGIGGYHIQFNIIDAETLKIARENPAEYKDLVVRVAGYSAFYVQLDPKIQDEILARTEQKF